MVYKIMKLQSNSSLRSNGYVPFESNVILAALPEDALKNVVNYLELIAKTNYELLEIYVLVNEDKEIVAYNTDLFELLMPFDN